MRVAEMFWGSDRFAILCVRVWYGPERCSVLRWKLPRLLGHSKLWTKSVAFLCFELSGCCVLLHVNLCCHVQLSSSFSWEWCWMAQFPWRFVFLSQGVRLVSRITQQRNSWSLNSGLTLQLYIVQAWMLCIFTLGNTCLLGSSICTQTANWNEQCVCEFGIVLS